MILPSENENVIGNYDADLQPKCNERKYDPSMFIPKKDLPLRTDAEISERINWLYREIDGRTDELSKLEDYLYKKNQHHDE